MRVYLIFPPVSPQFNTPYLSIPALGAFLKQEEPSWSVRMDDQNIELADRVLRPENFKRLQTSFEEQSVNHADAAMRNWFKCRLTESKKLDVFLRRFQKKWHDPLFLKKPGVVDYLYWRFVDVHIWLVEVLLSAVGPGCRTQQETLDWVEEFPEGIMTEYFRNEVAPEIIKFNPDLVGFSWVDSGQIVPSLVLLKILKEKGFLPRTVVGGPYVSLIWDRLKNSPLTNVIDHFVARQGEEPLLKLARSIADGATDEKPAQFLEPENPDIKRLPPPDFSDCNFDRYMVGMRDITILGSWGCYWGDCSFCNVCRLEGLHYKTRKPSQIAEDLAVIKERYNAHSVRIADNAISFSMMVKISKEIINRKVKLSWRTNTRFDGNWTAEGVKLIVEAGCSQLLIGLESPAPRTMKLVNKGTSLEKVHEILALLEHTPIHIRFYMIVGYPTETWDDVEYAVKFFKEFDKLFPRLTYSTVYVPFGLQIQGNVFYEPEKYGIEKIYPPDPEGWNTFCDYDVKPGEANLLKDAETVAKTRIIFEQIRVQHERNRHSLFKRIKTKLGILRVGYFWRFY